MNILSGKSLHKIDSTDKTKTGDDMPNWLSPPFSF